VWHIKFLQRAEAGNSEYLALVLLDRSMCGALLSSGLGLGAGVGIPVACAWPERRGSSRAGFACRGATALVLSSAQCNQGANAA